MFPAPDINADSEVPLYKQVFQQLKDSIHSGRLQKGSRLPATRELAGLLGLNRTTISAAYELLESEGLISGQVGRGSFVTGAMDQARPGLDWRALLAPSVWPAPPSQASVSSDSISFAASRPSELLFPIEEFRQCCLEVVGGAGIAAILQLGSPGGYGPLRQYLIAEARRSGVMSAEDDLIVTSGCQQALDLLQRSLVRPGDKVAVEDPVYPGVKNLFLRAGAQVAGVRMGRDGIDFDDLERVLETEKPKLLVVTPNFQNPTGATLPVEARRQLLERVRAAGVALIENDTYGELRYEGAAIPAAKSADTILLRSFSKIAFPGLRVGWAIGPRAVIARMTEAKQLSDLHSDQLSQAVLLRFAESGRLAAHRQRALEAGAERLKATLSACARYLPAGSTYTRPQGGMNLWVRLPEPLDAGELLVRAQRENVTYLPGRYFTVSRQDPGGLRLSFAGLTPEKIEAGIAILGGIFSAELERTGASGRLEPAPALV
ncbi:MAG TPA: PLP-dependent aminotransferase family protein [Bryobacteraceae bacterium]|nr:PLP-dependent aminotransferase family protein [Bryobacteraceae bacterium]